MNPSSQVAPGKCAYIMNWLSAEDAGYVRVCVGGHTVLTL